MTIFWKIVIVGGILYKVSKAIENAKKQPSVNAKSGPETKDSIKVPVGPVRHTLPVEVPEPPRRTPPIHIGQDPIPPVKKIKSPAPPRRHIPIPPVKKIIVPAPPRRHIPIPPVKKIIVPAPPRRHIPIPPVKKIIVPAPPRRHIPIPPVKKFIVPAPVKHIQSPVAPIRFPAMLPGSLKFLNRGWFGKVNF